MLLCVAKANSKQDVNVNFSCNLAIVDFIVAVAVLFSLCFVIFLIAVIAWFALYLWHLDDLFAFCVPSCLFVCVLFFF